MSKQLDVSSTQTSEILCSDCAGALSERERALAALEEAQEMIALLKDEVAIYKQVICDMRETELCRDCFGQRFAD
jgi:hypothetical protein